MGYLALGIIEQQGQPGGNVAISEGQGLDYQVHLPFYKGALLGGISLPLSDGKLLSSQALEEATLNALLGCAASPHRGTAPAWALERRP